MLFHICLLAFSFALLMSKRQAKKSQANSAIKYFREAVNESLINHGKGITFSGEWKN